MKMLSMVVIWLVSASSLPVGALDSFTNTHIFDGIFSSRERPLEACLDACADSPGCMGFDYNRNQRTCWLHRRSTICAERYQKNSCVHYSFVDCPMRSFIDRPLERFDNMNLQGGILDAQVDNIGDCLEACAGDPECQGFDFDTTDLGCWIHRTSECGELLPREGTVHYRFTQCPTVTATTPPPRRQTQPPEENQVVPELNTFRSFPEQSIPNGRPLPYIDSKPDCFDICWINERCTGFDWNQRLLRCRVHDTETECNSMRIDPGTSHYRIRTECPDQQVQLPEEMIPPVPQPPFPFPGTRAPRPPATPAPSTPSPSPGADPLCNTQFAPFTTEIGRRQGGDFLVARGVTLEQCQRLCRFTPTCGGFNWAILEQNCFLIRGRGVGEPVVDSCCVYSRMDCDPVADLGQQENSLIRRRSTTEAVTLPTTTTTTNPFQLVPVPPAPIRADGVCPESELFEYRFSILFGNSIPVPNVSDLEGCKQTCLVNSACMAADFNLQFAVPGLSCFLHIGPISPTRRLETNRACCSHFRKTQCSPKQCIVHEPVNIENIGSSEVLTVFDTLDIRPSGAFTAESVTCAGPCVTETSFSYDETGERIDFRAPITIARRCSDTEELPAGASGDAIQCVTRFNGDGSLGSKNCVCPGHRCNAFGVLLFPEIAAYFPFDRSTDDYSAARREGISTNVQYDPIDTQKNGSALFDGTAFIMVPTFAGVAFSRNQGVSNTNRPTFSVTVWVKREGVLGRGVILSNERRGRSSIEISSVIDATTTHRIHAGVKLNGTFYTINATAPINQWFFLTVMLVSHTPAPRRGPPPLTNNYFLVMHIDNDVLVEAFNDTGIPITDPNVVSTDVTTMPLCIGKQLSVPTNGGFLVQDDMFRGHLDELTIFSDSFTTNYMEAIRGVSEYPGQLYFP